MEGHPTSNLIPTSCDGSEVHRLAYEVANGFQCPGSSSFAFTAPWQSPRLLFCGDVSSAIFTCDAKHPNADACLSSHLGTIGDNHHQHLFSALGCGYTPKLLYSGIRMASMTMRHDGLRCRVYRQWLRLQGECLLADTMIINKMMDIKSPLILGSSQRITDHSITAQHSIYCSILTHIQ